MTYRLPNGKNTRGVKMESKYLTLRVKYRSDKMRKYMSIFNSSQEKLIESINRYYARRGWRIISIVKGNGDFWATLELETEKNND